MFSFCFSRTRVQFPPFGDRCLERNAVRGPCLDEGSRKDVKVREVNSKSTTIGDGQCADCRLLENEIRGSSECVLRESAAGDPSPLGSG